MSREVTSTHEKVCPCGQGSYRITFFSDDWGRVDELWQMVCPTCVGEFALHTYYYQDSGRTWPAFVWVNRKDLDRLQEDKARLSALQEEILKTARARHLQSWMARFSQPSSRKQMWHILTDGGVRYPSLSTFYQHTRGRDPRQYITSRFTVDNLRWILPQAGVEDVEISNRLAQAEQIRQGIETQEARLVIEGFQ